MRNMILPIICSLFLITSTQAQSLDDLLGLDDSQTIKSVTQEDKPKEHKSTADIDKQKALRLLNDENPSDLFEQVVTEMNDVANRLSQSELGEQTQQEQAEIIHKLDQIIAQAKQQSSSSSSQSQKQKQSQQDRSGKKQAKQKNSGTKQGQAKQQSGENKGQAGTSASATASENEVELRETRTEWGQLPERVRQEIKEGMNEPFSTKYKHLTEQYYKRIAEQSSLDNEFSD